MTPERWRQIKGIFEAVLEVTPAERPSLLERLCAGDAELRAEAERLLDEHVKAGGVLDQPGIRNFPV